MHNAPSNYKFKVAPVVSDGWREVDGIWRFCDKYGWRYVQPLTYRVTAFIFNVESYCDTERIVYWYDAFETSQDAISAAKNWALLRLEFQKDRSLHWLPVNFKGNKLPDYEIEREQRQ